MRSPLKNKLLREILTFNNQCPAPKNLYSTLRNGSEFTVHWDRPEEGATSYLVFIEYGKNEVLKRFSTGSEFVFSELQSLSAPFKEFSQGCKLWTMVGPGRFDLRLAQAGRFWSQFSHAGPRRFHVNFLTPF